MTAPTQRPASHSEGRKRAQEKAASVAAPAEPDADEREAAEAAFWREQEAGRTHRDRGGYYHRGFIDGFLASRTPDAYLAAAKAEALMEPIGPFEMDGFRGCTDRDPDSCACGTDSQPTCEECYEEIAPGDMAWQRSWPSINTLPLDHDGQEWEFVHWHDDCDAARAARLREQGGE